MSAPAGNIDYGTGGQEFDAANNPQKHSIANRKDLVAMREQRSVSKNADQLRNAGSAKQHRHNPKISLLDGQTRHKETFNGIPNSMPMHR